MNTTKAAATVVILRPDRQVLLVRRHLQSSFFAGAYAFPGGRIEANDIPLAAGPSADVWSGQSIEPAGLDSSAGDRARLYAGYLAAAVREVREETALVLAPEALRPWARWITPAAEPRRYDTLFFVTAAPAVAEVAVDGSEIVDHLWLTPEAALQQCAAEQIFLPPPTYLTLAELTAHDTTAAILSARRFPRPEILPTIVGDGSSTALLMPGDPEHPQARIAGWPANVSSRIVFAGPQKPWRFA